MAERYTRVAKDHVGVIPWEFESPHWYPLMKFLEYKGPIELNELDIESLDELDNIYSSAQRDLKEDIETYEKYMKFFFRLAFCFFLIVLGLFSVLLGVAVSQHAFFASTVYAVFLFIALEFFRFGVVLQFVKFKK